MVQIKVKLVLTCDRYACGREEEVDGLLSVLDTDDIENGRIPMPMYIQPEGWIVGRYGGCNYCPNHAWENR